MWMIKSWGQFSNTKLSLELPVFVCWSSKLEDKCIWYQISEILWSLRFQNVSESSDFQNDFNLLILWLFFLVLVYMQFTYCQAQLLFFSAQIYKFNSQSLNSEMKGSELTLKSQCAHPPTNNFIKLTKWVLLYLSTPKTTAIAKIKSVFVHYKISHFLKIQNS